MAYRTRNHRKLRKVLTYARYLQHLYAFEYCRGEEMGMDYVPYYDLDAKQAVLEAMCKRYGLPVPPVSSYDCPLY